MFNYWKKIPDEQILERWKKAEEIGRLNYIVRCALRFGSVQFIITSSFLYFSNDEYSFITFLICLIIGLACGWMLGALQWKAISMHGKNIKYRQDIDAEDDEYARGVSSNSNVSIGKN